MYNKKITYHFVKYFFIYHARNNLPFYHRQIWPRRYCMTRQSYYSYYELNCLHEKPPSFLQQVCLATTHIPPFQGHNYGKLRLIYKNIYETDNNFDKIDYNYIYSTNKILTDRNLCDTQIHEKDRSQCHVLKN